MRVTGTYEGEPAPDGEHKGVVFMGDGEEAGNVGYEGEDIGHFEVSILLYSRLLLLGLFHREGGNEVQSGFMIRS